jgi:hypothetical protein
MVGSVSTDRAGLKDAFGEYSYETKTKGMPLYLGLFILSSLPRSAIVVPPSFPRLVLRIWPSEARVCTVPRCAKAYHIGTRTQPAARPAARGHYILHSPRDEAADSPDHNKQRDYKTLLAYEITTPPPEDFGRVQEELGLEQRGAVALSVKDPDAASGGNPRAANMPREKKAHVRSQRHYTVDGDGC